MQRYVRTQGGKKVHRQECPVVQRLAFPMEWAWARGRTVPQIRMQAVRLGIRMEFHACCSSTEGGEEGTRP